MFHLWMGSAFRVNMFQSASSEEDGVSTTIKKVAIYVFLFQSTPSEEDVVFSSALPRRLCVACFNPRPPKRTLCPIFSGSNASRVMFQSASSEEDVVSAKV